MYKSAVGSHGDGGCISGRIVYVCVHVSMRDG